MGLNALLTYSSNSTLSELNHLKDICHSASLVNNEIDDHNSNINNNNEYFDNNSNPSSKSRRDTGLLFNKEKLLVKHIRENTIPLEYLRELSEEIGFISADLQPFSQVFEGCHRHIDNLLIICILYSSFISQCTRPWNRKCRFSGR